MCRTLCPPLKVRVEKDQGLVRLSGLPLPLDALAGKMMVFLPQKLHAQFQVVSLEKGTTRRPTAFICSVLLLMAALRDYVTAK